MASSLPPDTHASHPLSTSRESRAASWARANGRLLQGAAAVVVVAAVGGLFWRSNERAREARAERALLNAEAALLQANGGNAESGLRAVVTRHGGTAAGAQARLLLAQTLYEQGRYQDGLTALQGGEPPAQFAAAFDLLRAAGLEGLSRGAEAARIYERLASGTGVVARRRDELRANAARAYQLANDRSNALRLWRTILDQGSGPALDEARVRVGELSAAG